MNCTCNDNNIKDIETQLNNNTTASTNHHHHHQLFRSQPLRHRNKQLPTTASAIFTALLLLSTAWFFLVFSSSSSTSVAVGGGRCSDVVLNATSTSDHSLKRHVTNNSEDELALHHLVFGIAGSAQLWSRRKDFIKLWWRPGTMRGHVWLDENVKPNQDEERNDVSSLPPIMVSEDTSRFRYTNPTGHPSGLRISRIITEAFRLGLPDVRWYVLGDDDTIFNVDNLVDVLRKYDYREMVYIGTPSESHSANTYFSYSMAYGGGGIVISYPLARALSEFLDECLDRYNMMYGSDDRLHACISEVGVPLSREFGFHQWDIRGNAYGMLSSHPVAPFVSIHHVEAVDPFYPGLSVMDSLKLFVKAMEASPMSFLQRSVCYHRRLDATISVSLGYVVQVFNDIVVPRELDRSELTYSAWNEIKHRNEFDLDTKDTDVSSICKTPFLFFLKEVAKLGNGTTLGTYSRADSSKDDFKRKLFCFGRSHPLLRHVKTVRVLVYPLMKDWHLSPRRLCSKVNHTRDGDDSEVLNLIVGQCDRGSLGSFISNL